MGTICHNFLLFNSCFLPIFRPLKMRLFLLLNKHTAPVKRMGNSYCLNSTEAVVRQRPLSLLPTHALIIGQGYHYVVCRRHKTWTKWTAHQVFTLCERPMPHCKHAQTVAVQWRLCVICNRLISSLWCLMLSHLHHHHLPPSTTVYTLLFAERHSHGLYFAMIWPLPTTTTSECTRTLSVTGQCEPCHRHRHPPLSQHGQQLRCGPGATPSGQLWLVPVQGVRPLLSAHLHRRRHHHCSSLHHCRP